MNISPSNLQVQTATSTPEQEPLKKSEQRKSGKFKSLILDILNVEPSKDLPSDREAVLQNRNVTVNIQTDRTNQDQKKYKHPVRRVQSMQLTKQGDSFISLHTLELNDTSSSESVRGQSSISQKSSSLNQVAQRKHKAGSEILVSPKSTDSLSDVSSLQSCQDRLNEIYTRLQEVEKADFKPRFLRQLENYALTLEDKKTLKWSKIKIWSMEGAFKTAILQVLRTINAAFAAGLFQFKPVGGTDYVDTAQLLRMLRDNMMVGKILHRDRAIRDEWIKIQFANLYGQNKQQAKDVLMVLDTAMKSIEDIASELAKYQKAEIEKTKSLFISDADWNNKSLKAMNLPQLMQIVTALDLKDIFSKVGNHSEMLESYIFNRNGGAHGFIDGVATSYMDFYKACKVKLEGYLSYLSHIMKEDPNHHYSSIEYYIHYLNTKDGAEASKSEKFAGIAPNITEDSKGKLKALFNDGAYVGCINVLTDKIEQNLGMQHCVQLTQQFCLRAIVMENKKGCLSYQEAFDLVKSVKEAMEPKPQWHKIADLLHIIASKLPRVMEESQK